LIPVENSCSANRTSALEVTKMAPGNRCHFVKKSCF
jgi:hypothetical protein